jgi:hypothetical protein
MWSNDRQSELPHRSDRGARARNACLPRRQIRHNAVTRPHGHFLRTLCRHPRPQRRVPPFPRNPGARGWRTHRTRNPGRAEWLPQGARVGWLDGQDLFLDIDSAYRVARAAAAGVDGLAVGSQTLIKRLHESGRLKSIDERRQKLKIRRVVDGRRLEVLHLPADVLEHSIVEKPAQQTPQWAGIPSKASRVPGRLRQINWASSLQRLKQFSGPRVSGNPRKLRKVRGRTFTHDRADFGDSEKPDRAILGRTGSTSRKAAVGPGKRLFLES